MSRSPASLRVSVAILLVVAQLVAVPVFADQPSTPAPTEQVDQPVVSSRALERRDMGIMESGEVGAKLGSVAHDNTFTSPWIDRPSGSGSAELRFVTLWQIESVNPSGFDLMSVEYSADGSSWNTLGRLNPSSDPPYGNHDVGLSNQGLNQPPVWQQVKMALPSDVLAAERFRLRFSFATVDSLYNAFEGWYVDDIKVIRDGVVRYSEDFEGATASAWSRGGSGGMWHVTTRRWKPSVTSLFSNKSAWCGVPSQGNFFKGLKASGTVPVVLVNGLNSPASRVSSLDGQSGSGVLKDMYDYLQGQGFEVHTPAAAEYPWTDDMISYRGDLGENGKRFKRYLDSEFGWRGIKEVDIVAHSMGGLIARSYAAQYPNGIKIRRIIQLGTPNNGHKGQVLGDRLNTHFFGEAAAQMRKAHMKKWNPLNQFASSTQVHLFAGTVMTPIWPYFERMDDGVVQVDSVFSLAAERKTQASLHAHSENAPPADRTPDLIHDPTSFLESRVVAALKGQYYSASTMSVQETVVANDYQTVVDEHINLTDQGDVAASFTLPASEEVFLVLESDSNEVDASLITGPGVVIFGEEHGSDEGGSYSVWQLENGMPGAEAELLLSGQPYATVNVRISAASPVEVEALPGSISTAVAGLPIVLAASVPSAPGPHSIYAEVSSDEWSSPVSIALADDGVGADETAGDGIHSGWFTPTTTGEYGLRYIANGPMGDGSNSRVLENSLLITADETAFTHDFELVRLYTGEDVSGLSVEAGVAVDQGGMYAFQAALDVGGVVMTSSWDGHLDQGDTSVGFHFDLDQLLAMQGTDVPVTLTGASCSSYSHDESVFSFVLDEIVEPVVLGQLSSNELLRESAVLHIESPLELAVQGMEISGLAESSVATVEQVKLTVDQDTSSERVVWAVADDGGFGGESESFTVKLPEDMTHGPHTLDVEALLSDGRVLNETRGMMVVHFAAPLVGLNEGAPARSTEVTMTLSAPGFDEFIAVEMEAPGPLPPSDHAWLPLVESTAWELSEGEGYKTVAVWFRQSGQAIAGPVTASVIVDTTPPVVSAHQYVEGSRRLVQISAYDASASGYPSGVASVGFAVDGQGEEYVEGSYHVVEFTDPAVSHEIEFWASDHAGNMTIRESIPVEPISMLFVPSQYPDISAALAEADEGDVIAIEPGVYSENVVLDKAVSLVGVDPTAGACVIEAANPSLPTLVASVEGVTIEGITISGSDFASLYADGVGSISASACVLSGSAHGAYLLASSGNSFVSCSFENNTAVGLALYFSDNNRFDSCTFSGNDYGAYLMYANTNVLAACEIVSNRFYGLFLDQSSQNTIEQCFVAESPYAGLALYFNSNHNLVQDSSFYGNGFGAYAFASGQNTFEYSSFEGTYYGLFFENADDNALLNCGVYGNAYAGVALYAGSERTVLQGCSLDGNGFGVYGHMSDGAVVSSTTVGSGYYGLFLDGCSGWDVANSTVWGAAYSGMALYFSSSGNLLRNLDIQDNGFGIYLVGSPGNAVLHNRFVSNAAHAFDDTALGINQFDDGYSGNYWDDHEGKTTPYPIAGGSSVDWHPMPFGWY